MNDTIEAYGIRLRVPDGWEAELALVDDTDRALVHCANFAMPVERGDYGSGAVERMDSGGIFVALMEWDTESARTALFDAGLPAALAAEEFSVDSLQRPQGGQAGAQRFARVGERAFGLYVVLGSLRRAGVLVPEVNRVLAGLTIS